MTDNDFPMLFYGMLQVIENTSQWVAEHSACFVKGDFVFLDVRSGFRLVPFKLHALPHLIRRRPKG